MVLTDVLEIQLGPPWDRLVIESFQHQSDSFGGRIWIVTRVHGQNFDDDVLLACDDSHTIREGAPAVYEWRMLAKRPAM